MRQAIAAISKPYSLTKLVLLGLLAIVSYGCGDPSAGAVGTGNAGRIMGTVVASAAARTGIQVRLLSVDSSSKVVDSIAVDSSGAFEFPPPKHVGVYRVELWKGGVLRGESGKFTVQGEVTGLLVVLVQGVFQQTLDLSPLGDVDSVFVDYPGNQGVKIGSLWRIQTIRESEFVLHVHVGKAPGRWEEWVMVRRNGQNLFMNLADSRSMDFQRTIDTTSFLLTSRTMALWTFDSVVAGSLLPDRSGRGNDLSFSGVANFVASPHGRAFQQSTGKPLVAGTSLPAALRWSTTGSMTYEMRLRLDSLPMTGMVLMGSYGGPRIWVTAFGQIVVENLMTVTGGQSILSVVTGVGKIPVGKWIDLAVSVDGKANQIYVWVDEQAQPVFKRDEWSDEARLAIDTTSPLCVGGATWDQRPSYFQIDEVRISDTLVFGMGQALQSSSGVKVEGGAIGKAVGLASKGATISVCTNCAEIRVGMDAAKTTEGFYAMRVDVPQAVVGKQIVSALLCTWSATPGWIATTKGFSVHRILEDWLPGDPATDWFDAQGKLKPTRVDMTPLSVAPLNAGSSGGIVFDLSGIMQSWADDTSTVHGILIRAVDNASVGDDIAAPGSANTSVNPAFLKIRYR